ncbi:UTP11-like, U3 small nucleolar ribonucleoprotein [Tyrophagus putrescentiae]|nr:UTP11-like, U3 small nucleolar ribonucleoprotein [Tyrophagus putrescentiae]
MGSFDKAFKSKARVHRERVNVLKKGFLERKKDYKVRAKEFNRREHVLTKLRQKALDKNPNEFYFHMKRSKLVDGVHYDIRNDDEELAPEEAKLMQTQDLNYINYKRAIDAKRIEKLQSELHFIDREKKRFNFAEKMKVDSELLEMGFNIANPSAIGSVSLEDIESSAQVKATKYRRLENKVAREQFLKTLSGKMQTKKALLNKKESAKKVKKGTADAPPVITTAYSAAGFQSDVGA